MYLKRKRNYFHRWSQRNGLRIIEIRRIDIGFVYCNSEIDKFLFRGLHIHKLSYYFMAKISIPYKLLLFEKFVTTIFKHE